MPSLDLLNLIIAVLALLVALYSVHYTRSFNRRKITVSSGTFYINSDNPPIAWFEIHNISPVPVTIFNVEFFSSKNEQVYPILDYEPIQTYSASGPFNAMVPDIIADYQYSEPLDAPCIIQPYESLELGYYFDKKYNTLSITVTCAERIHRFRKSQSFSIHFSDVND